MSNAAMVGGDSEEAYWSPVGEFCVHCGSPAKKVEPKEYDYTFVCDGKGCVARARFEYASWLASNRKRRVVSAYASARRMIGFARAAKVRGDAFSMKARLQDATDQRSWARRERKILAREAARAEELGRFAAVHNIHAVEGT